MSASTINTECKRYGCMKNLLACCANCRYTMRCDELRNEIIDKTAEAEGDINRYLSERGRAPILVQILKRGVKFDHKATRPPRPSVAMAAPAARAAKPRVELPPPPPPSTKVKSSRMAKPGRQTAKDIRDAIKARESAVRVAVKEPDVKRAGHRKRRANRPSRVDQAIKLPTPATIASPRAASLRVASGVTGKPGASRSRKKSKMPRRAKPEATAKTLSVDSTVGSSPEATNKPTAGTKPAAGRAAPRKQAATKPRKSAAKGKVYIIIEGQTASVVDEQGLMIHLFNNTSRTARYFEASEVEARVQIVPKR